VRATSVLQCLSQPEIQRAAARNYVNNNTPPRLPRRPHARRDRPKIRLGYLSADFVAHPTSYLVAELIELHDRSRFGIHAFSSARDDGSAMRKRIQNAFDVFTDVTKMSDGDLSRAIESAQIDILIDLGGHTGSKAEGRILSMQLRPAPIQVTYLGYPGTTGADFIDYAIVDQFIVPLSEAKLFTEKLVYMPDSYQINDRKREVADRTPSRQECSLPEDAFVFCSFNRTYKINPVVFDVWMRLLHNVPNSVLWIMQDNPTATRNLLKEARARNVNPDRLVFADHVALPDHLARQRLADLSLDTWPYNAHTTASDALWGGPASNHLLRSKLCRTCRRKPAARGRTT
jgi:protein O-GlcNAc transferase